MQLTGGSTIEIVADGKMVIHQMSLRANVTSGNVVVGCVLRSCSSEGHDLFFRSLASKALVMSAVVAHCFLTHILTVCRFVEYTAVNTTVICVEQSAVVPGKLQ